MTSSHNNKDKNSTTYSSIPQQQQPEEEERQQQQQQQRDDNGDCKEQKQQERKENVTLLKVDPHTVSIAMTDSHDDNNQDDYFSKTCRICGEGEEEEEEEEDDERRLYPEQTTIPSSSYSTEQQKILSNQQRQRKRQQEKKFTFNNYDNPLIRPCKCKGSMMYVHIDCLNRWRELSPRQESYVACDLCGYQYNIYRPKFAAIVSHGYFLKSITLFMIVLLTIGMGYLCKWIHIYLILQEPDNNNKEEEEEQEEGLLILGLNHIYLFCGLISVSIFGIIYMIYCCTIQSSTDTNNNGATSPLLPITSGWLCCCDNNSNMTTFYGCYITDFTTCSGDAALGGIIVFIAFVILATIIFGILNVFSGIYSLIESIVQHVAGRVKERILDCT